MALLFGEIVVSKFLTKRFYLSLITVVTVSSYAVKQHFKILEAHPSHHFMKDLSGKAFFLNIRLFVTYFSFLLKIGFTK